MVTRNRIRWAPKLDSAKLVRLYESDATGLLDAELVDDVGWRLWARLDDVRRVTTSRVRCPECGVDFAVDTRRGPDAVSTCACGWNTTAGDYHRSWEHRDLNGHSDRFGAFLRSWPVARTPRQRMMLIDGVVHALHRSARNDSPRNFAARNFIEGRRPRIVALLEALASGPASTVDLDARARYKANRDWYRNLRSAKP